MRWWVVVRTGVNSGGDVSSIDIQKTPQERSDQIFVPHLEETGEISEKLQESLTA